MQLFDENFSAQVKTHWQNHPELGEMTFIDLETTGLSPLINEVIEIGCVKITNNGDLVTFHSLIKPQNQISEANFQIHGIDNLMVENAPKLSEVFPTLLDFIGDSTLVGHNIQFDCGFLIAHAATEKQNFKKNLVQDTCLLSRQVAKHNKSHPKDHKLQTLADIFNIQHQHHRALSDSLICLKVFLNLMERVPDPKAFKHLFWYKSFVYRMPDLDVGDLWNEKDLGMCEKDSILLKKALADGNKLMISYEGGTHGDELRPIKPVALLPMPKGMVLHAECLLTKLMKNFKLKKIKNLSLE